VIAVGLGVFLDNYESKNPCPTNCAIDHEHIYYAEQTKDKDGDNKRIAE